MKHLKTRGNKENGEMLMLLFKHVNKFLKCIVTATSRNIASIEPIGCSLLSEIPSVTCPIHLDQV